MHASASTHFAELALAFVLLLTRGASAEVPTNVVAVVGGDTSRALDALVEERVTAAGAALELTHVARIEPAVLLAPPANAPRALAHVWIDAASGDRYTLLLLDERLERGLLRYVTRARGDEIAREELGHILQTALEALLAGETIGVTREALYEHTVPRRPTPTPMRNVNTQAHAARCRAASAGTYEVDAFAAGTFLHGPGLSFDVRCDVVRTIALGVRLTGQDRYPVDISASSFGFTVQSWAGRVLGTVTLRATSGWSTEAAVGAGIDVEHVVPTVATGGSTLASPSSRAAFVARAGVWFVRTQPLRVALGVVVDADTSGATFDVLEQGTRHELFAAYALRPGVMLEIGTP